MSDHMHVSRHIEVDKVMTYIDILYLDTSLHEFTKVIVSRQIFSRMKA